MKIHDHPLHVNTLLENLNKRQSASNFLGTSHQSWLSTAYMAPKKGDHKMFLIEMLLCSYALGTLWRWRLRRLISLPPVLDRTPALPPGQGRV